MRRKIRFGDRATIPLTPADRQLILEHTDVRSELKERVPASHTPKSRVHAALTLDEIDELLNAIATAANDADDEDLKERLDALHRRLTELEATYEELDEEED